jgi:hypothetical protein
VTLTTSEEEMSDHFHATGVDGMLQTSNRGQTFERKGDTLLWCMMAGLPGLRSNPSANEHSV